MSEIEINEYFIAPPLTSYKTLNILNAKSLSIIKKSIQDCYELEFKRNKAVSEEIKSYKLEIDKTKLILLENALKKANKKRKWEYLLDTFKGHRSDLRKQIKVAKKNDEKQIKFQETKNIILKNLKEIDKDLIELKSCIDNLAVNSNVLNLGKFVSFKYYVECTYKFTAQETEEEPYTDYEDYQVQIPFNEIITTSRGREEVTRYRFETRQRQVTKYRTVVKHQEDFEETYDASSLFSETPFISKSSFFDDWESAVNEIEYDSQYCYESIQDYTSEIKKDYLGAKDKNLKLNEIEDEKESNEIFSEYYELNLRGKILEILEDDVSSKVRNFINSSRFNTYEIHDYDWQYINTENKNLIMPFLLQEIEYDSKKWKKNIVIYMNNLLIDNERFVDTTQESLKENLDSLKEKIDNNEKLLKEAKMFSLPAIKAPNLRPVMLSLLGCLVLILVANLLVVNYKENRCKNEIEIEKITDFCEEYFLKSLD